MSVHKHATKCHVHVRTCACSYRFIHNTILFIILSLLLHCIGICMCVYIFVHIILYIIITHALCIIIVMCVPSECNSMCIM